MHSINHSPPLFPANDPTAIATRRGCFRGPHLQPRHSCRRSMAMNRFRRKVRITNLFTHLGIISHLPIEKRPLMSRPDPIRPCRTRTMFAEILCSRYAHVPETSGPCQPVGRTPPILVMDECPYWRKTILLPGCSNLFARSQHSILNSPHNVFCVARVVTLRVLLTVKQHRHGSHVVQEFARRKYPQVSAGVRAPVAVPERVLMNE